MCWIARSTAALFLLPTVLGAVIHQQPLQLTPHACIDDDPSARTKLRALVGDRLIRVDPVGKPCYTSTLQAPKECTVVNATKTDDFWLSHQPGGYFYYNWASCQATDQTCTLPLDDKTALPPWPTCHQGSVPCLAINLTSIDTLIDDIEAAFEYTRSTGRPLVIKNTGHNVLGRSAAPNSLALWTHHLQHPVVPIVLNRAFVPENCSECTPEAVFHYGPGQQWGEAYRFAEEHELGVVGGSCPTVGVAGWLQGGGHSPLTPAFGMGVDNVRQVEIVTPRDGRLVANEHSNKELFFAIRGGGGGAWGVITNITYKAISKPDFVDFHYSFTSSDKDDIEEYYRILTSNAVAWSKAGWGGYIKASPTGQRVELVKPKSTVADAEVDMEELTNFLDKVFAKLPPEKYEEYTFLPRGSMVKYIEDVMSPHVGFSSMNFASRLLNSTVFSGHQKARLDNALSELTFKNKLSFWLMLVTPSKYPHTTTSALHPSWKNAVMSVRVNDKWDQFQDINKPARKHFTNVHNSFATIRELGSGMATSINEADIWEEDHEQQYWGQNNTERLVLAKHEADPENLLTNWGAVNWSQDDASVSTQPSACNFHATFFPAGTTVGINASVMSRQPDLFGQDLDQFRPERWLEDKQRAKEMDRCLFAFGAGARVWSRQEHLHAGNARN